MMNAAIDAMDKVSFGDRETILDIARRASDMAEQLAGQRIAPIEFVMDLIAAHAVSPLKLDDLLAADASNFAHDVFGIRHHIDRDTGAMTDCFLPRFTAPIRQDFVPPPKHRYLVILDLPGAPSGFGTHEFTGTDLEFIAFARGLGFEVTGMQEGIHLRAELRGRPTFEGLCGPMWGGCHDDADTGWAETGEPITRYEDWKAFERLSR